MVDCAKNPAKDFYQILNINTKRIIKMRDTIRLNWYYFFSTTKKDKKNDKNSRTETKEEEYILNYNLSQSKEN